MKDFDLSDADTRLVVGDELRQLLDDLDREPPPAAPQLRGPRGGPAPARSGPSREYQEKIAAARAKLDRWGWPR